MCVATPSVKHMISDVSVLNSRCNPFARHCCFCVDQGAARCYPSFPWWNLHVEKNAERRQGDGRTCLAAPSVHHIISDVYVRDSRCKFDRCCSVLCSSLRREVLPAAFFLHASWRPQFLHQFELPPPARIGLTHFGLSSPVRVITLCRED